ncbi:YlmH family RNA-binding protein [Bacillus massiliglaciei]|uniref:YlmH family RNA-binding protein n=1 Tax=Bacillus massiliglaciei TaxID=1816693 RepID=UPI000A579E8A|nr:RNA-binding protein [Bacillus massiliglaciei]
MSIYQHYRPDEKEFIDQSLGWIDLVKRNYSPKLTDFLDPRQQQILTAILGNDPEAGLEFFGGGDQAERKRALLYPDYLTPQLSDFQLALYEVVYPSKFVTLDHRQVLGSLMSLGLKREKFGDILIAKHQVQFAASEEIGDYIRANLNKIGQASVTVKRIPLEKIAAEAESWIEQTCTVSSLRLDAVLSTILNISRQKSQALIAGGKVKLNFKQTESVTEDCCEGDILSVRGYGRCKVFSIEGKTKKDKWRINIGKKK